MGDLVRFNGLLLVWLNGISVGGMYWVVSWDFMVDY